MENQLTKNHRKITTLAINGMVMAVYLAVTIMIKPLASGAVQFRLSESLNHLVVFNKKLMWGVLGGVIVYNILFSEFGWLDVVFGGSQTFLSLGLTALLAKYVPNIKIRLALNTVIFTVSMALIAWMLHIAIDLPFWATYGTTALGEFVVMAVSAPLMYYIDKHVHFADRL